MDEEQLKQELDSLASAAECVCQLRNTSLHALFPEDFVCKFSNHSNINDLLRASGFSILCQADIEKARTDGFDTFIQNTTSFDDWDCMVEAAVCHWIQNNHK